MADSKARANEPIDLDQYLKSRHRQSFPREVPATAGRHPRSGLGAEYAASIRIGLETLRPSPLGGRSSRITGISLQIALHAASVSSQDMRRRNIVAYRAPHRRS